MTIGEKIASLRKQRGLTQEQLAERLSVTPQAVSKWENSITSPDVSLIPEIARIFNVSIDSLFGMEQKAYVAEASNIDSLMLRIRVNSGDGDKVNINLPFSIVSALLSTGAISTMLGGNDALKNLDWAMVSRLIETGLRGKIVEVCSADGDIVEIVVE